MTNNSHNNTKSTLIHNQIKCLQDLFTCNKTTTQTPRKKGYDKQQTYKTNKNIIQNYKLTRQKLKQDDIIAYKIC